MTFGDGDSVADEFASTDGHIVTSWTVGTALTDCGGIKSRSGLIWDTCLKVSTRMDCGRSRCCCSCCSCCCWSCCCLVRELRFELCFEEDGDRGRGESEPE